MPSYALHLKRTCRATCLTRWCFVGVVVALALALDGCRFLRPPAPAQTWVALPTLAPEPTQRRPASPTQTPTAFSVTATPVAPTATRTRYATRTMEPMPLATEVQNPATLTARASVTVTTTALPSQALIRVVPITRIPSSEWVQGWVGYVRELPPSSGYDDYFEGRSPAIKCGIASLDSRLAADLQTYRRKGTQIRIWGMLDYGVQDYGGRRIVVTNIELVR